MAKKKKDDKPPDDANQDKITEVQNLLSQLEHIDNNGQDKEEPAETYLPQTSTAPTVMLHGEEAPEIAPPAPATEQPTWQIDVGAVMTDFDKTNTEILDAWRQDREQIQSALQDIESELGVDSGNAPLTPGDRRTYIEARTELLATKVNSSLVAVKALEAKTKLLAALRGPLMMKPQDTGSMDVASMLSDDTIPNDA